jgi:hypothetical protein
MNNEEIMINLGFDKNSYIIKREFNNVMQKAREDERKRILEIIDDWFIDLKSESERGLFLIEKEKLMKKINKLLSEVKEKPECDCQMFIGGSGKLCPKCRKKGVSR